MVWWAISLRVPGLYTISPLRRTSVEYVLP
jgi:hypothetical protein